MNFPKNGKPGMNSIIPLMMTGTGRYIVPIKKWPAGSPIYFLGEGWLSTGIMIWTR
jgi:hypothetical protein